MNIQGSCVALVTPFTEGRVDEERLTALVEWHIQEGTDALVPCGTTGESATLSHEEHQRVIELVVQAAHRRIPVIAGTGSNSTAETIALTRFAEQAGADAALVITPYYNKPTQAGLYGHFRAVATAMKLPLILYNIPGRTAVNLLPETVLRLAHDCPTIIGIKEGSGVMDQGSEIIRGASLNPPPALSGVEGPTPFTVLAGDDALTLPILALGGRGVVSVLANIAPRTMVELCAAWREGRVARAQELHHQWFPMMKALFLETNPVPIKTAMGLMGLCREEVRLPLVSLGEAARGALVQALKASGLLSLKVAR
ncbi:MAG: 4-hydroxy-tetrahydrodipicolinate synthase [Elusimicrobia bacterium]|nr:4-hydroxy-tetrahydrodipicolinate synthase [Elusimicrobiota bacterium]